MEKVYARFLTKMKEDNGQGKIRLGGVVLQYTEFDEQTTAMLKEEMSEYEVVVDEDYSYEYDEDDHPTYGSDRKVVDVDKVVSLTSGWYSSSDPRGDCLIVGGHFAGVVLYLENTGGNGWSNYNDKWYAVLYADGRIEGENSCHYSFNGESSSKEYEYEYTLRKKAIKE